MTKARSMAAKRAQKALQAACPISGVRLSAAPEKPASGRENGQADEAAFRRALDRRCAMMGWPCDDKHRAKAKDQKMGTLYGRLSLADRFGPSGSVATDAFLGLAEFDRLDRQFRRIVLGASIPGDADGPSAGEECDPKAIASKWAEAQGMLTAQGPAAREAVLWVIAAPDDVGPDAVSGREAIRVTLAGLQLARHFGLRT